MRNDLVLREYLAIHGSYHRTGKNCRSEMVIRTGWGQAHEEAFRAMLISLAEAGLMCRYRMDM